MVITYSKILFMDAACNCKKSPLENVSGTRLTHLFGQDISHHTPEPKDLSVEQSPQGLNRAGLVKADEGLSILPLEDP